MEQDRYLLWLKSRGVFISANRSETFCNENVCFLLDKSALYSVLLAMETVYRFKNQTKIMKPGWTYLNLSNINSSFSCKSYSAWSKQFLIDLINILQQNRV